MEIKSKKSFDANFELKLKDVALSPFDKIGSFAKHLAKTTEIQGLKKLNDKLLESDDKTSGIEEIRSLKDNFVTREYLRGGNVIKGKLPSGRTAAEKLILRDKLNNQISTRTKFSPFKVRREMYKQSYTKAFREKKVEAYKKLKNKVQASVKKLGSKVPTPIKKFSRGFVDIGKAIFSGARIIISSIATAITSIVTVLLPVILFITITFAIFQSSSANAMEDIKASGTIAGDTIYIKIYSENETLADFSSRIKDGQFTYSTKDKKVILVGKVKGNQINITGSINSDNIVLDGEVVDNKFELTGFIGDMQSSAGKFQNPYGKRRYTITSPFMKNRVDPITGELLNHDGWDLVVGEGTPIYASASGTVTFAGVEPWGAKMVTISHGSGITTSYAHLSKITVKQDQKVRKGQKIGEEGSSGHSTGSHLHFEFRKDGKAVDVKYYYKDLFKNAINGKEWQK